MNILKQGFGHSFSGNQLIAVDYFPFIGDQLDALWRDINAGKFGETAKTGEWYLAMKAVKDKYPKG